MANEQLPNSARLLAFGLPPVSSAHPASNVSAGGSALTARPAPMPAAPHAADLRRLEALAAQSGLRVQVETLPQGNLTMIHLIDSPTGYVVGEFPPEGVAQALTELEAQAATRPGPPALDHLA